MKKSTFFLIVFFLSTMTLFLFECRSVFSEDAASHSQTREQETGQSSEATPVRTVKKKEQERLIARVTDQKVKKALRAGKIGLTPAEYYESLEQKGASSE
jgi:hypothetical protein